MPPKKTRRKAVKEKVAASVFIYDAASMSPSGRREVAAWLKAQAAYLLENGDELSKTFRARYIYRTN